MKALYPRIALAAALLVYFALALYRLDYPGLHYDEVFFVNGAFGGLDGSFIFARILGWPLYIMPYIGALKSWLYWPVFQAFGVSVESIRIPMVLVGAAGIALFARVAWMLGGPLVSALAAALLVMNPTFVWGMRAELGPVAIEFFLQALGAFAFLQGWGVAAMAGIFLLGLFNKVSFVWWLAGFTAGALLYRPEKKKALISAAGIALLYLPVWRWMFPNEPLSAAPISLADRWQLVSSLWRRVVDGTYFYEAAFDQPQAWHAPANLWMLLLFGGWLYLCWRQRREFRVGWMLGTQVLLTFLLIFCSSRASAYWHVYHLLPWFLLLSAVVLVRLRWLGWAFAGLVLVQSAALTADYLRKPGSRPVNPTFSMAIYDVRDWCLAEGRKCVSVEWGIHNQIFAFGRDSSRSWEFHSRPELKEENHYLAFHDSVRPMRADRRFFFDQAEEKGWDVAEERRFEENGMPVFEVYRVTKKNGPASSRSVP